MACGLSMLADLVMNVPFNVVCVPIEISSLLVLVLPPLLVHVIDLVVDSTVDSLVDAFGPIAVVDLIPENGTVPDLLDAVLRTAITITNIHLNADVVPLDGGNY